MPRKASNETPRMEEIYSHPKTLALLKAAHDGVVQNIAEKVLLGHDDPWLLHVCAVHSDAAGDVGIVLQDESKPIIRNALARSPDEEGLKVLVNAFLHDPLIEEKMHAEIGAGSRCIIYGRCTFSGGQACIRVDVIGRFFCEKTEHLITRTPNGAANVALTAFPKAVELDVGVLVFPINGGEAYFMNTKKDAS